MRLIRISLLFTIFICNICHSYEITYKEITGDDTINYMVSSHDTDEGYKISTDGIIKDKNVISSKFIINKRSSIERWEYKNSLINIDFLATRESNRIKITGTEKGNKIEKDVKIDDNPWFQIFPDIPYCLDNFAQANDERIEFWTLSVKPLNGFLAVALRSDQKTISISKQNINTTVLTIFPSGVGSMFWKEKYFFQKTNGRFVFVDGKIKSKKENTKIEFVEERQE